MSNNFIFWVIVIALWTIPWKGIALWKAARREERVWFAVLMVVNTAGLLEALYIFFFSRKRKVINNFQNPY